MYLLIPTLFWFLKKIKESAHKLQVRDTSDNEVLPCDTCSIKSYVSHIIITNVTTLIDSLQNLYSWTNKLYHIGN